MGLLDRWNRREHRSSINWEMATQMMVLGYELGLAERDGVLEHDAQVSRAGKVMDAVVEEIGWERLVQAFVEADYSMQTKDKSAVSDRALWESGYMAVRERLFPAGTSESIPVGAGVTGTRAEEPSPELLKYFTRLEALSVEVGERQASLGDSSDLLRFWADATANLASYQQEIESLEVPRELDALHRDYVEACSGTLRLGDRMTEALRRGADLGRASQEVFGTEEANEINDRADHARKGLERAAERVGIDLQLVEGD